MDERTERAIRKLSVALYLQEIDDLIREDVSFAIAELQRLSALVDAAPKWMERPSGPGLIVSQRSAKDGPRFIVFELLAEDIKRGAPFNSIQVIHIPIPKGTPDGT